MIIKNGTVFCESGTFSRKDIEITGSVISAVRDPQSEEASCLSAGSHPSSFFEADGLYVIPGFVDIHFHGCSGYDFCDGTQEAFTAIADYQLQHGITSMTPATMTLSEAELSRIFRAAGAWSNETGSTLRGITMEGPFLSTAKKGAQNAAFLHKPDYDFYKKMQELCHGMIRQVAFAPEEDTDLEFCRKTSQETVLSVAHTISDYETAKAAFEHGASHLTHLYNAMPSLHHRNPGVIAAAAEQPHVFAELICDGIHIHPAMVRLAFRLFGDDRICMISDSMMAAGLTDGSYQLGGQAVTVAGRTAVLADGTIAGSASNLMDCFRTAVTQMDIPLESAIKACTINPAKSIGLDRECGSICAGKAADLLILDPDLNLLNVMHKGRFCFAYPPTSPHKLL